MDKYTRILPSSDPQLLPAIPTDALEVGINSENDVMIVGDAAAAGGVMMPTFWAALLPVEV
jgi:hypothetical protein